MLRISEICKEKGLTQQSLAQKLGITYQSLHSAITGNPKLETLCSIANALNVTVVELFEKLDASKVIGFVKVGNTVHEVKSVEDVKNLAEKL